MTMPLDEPIPLRIMALCLLTVLMVSVIPLYLVDYPPLFDLPFHVARFDILLRWSESAFLQKRYALNSFLLPNLGSDVVVVVLAQVLPLPLTVAWFLTLIMAIAVVCCFPSWTQLTSNHPPKTTKSPYSTIGGSNVRPDPI